MLDRIKAYAKLIPKAISNLPAVIEGVVNDVKLNHGSLQEDEKEEIIKRRVICKTCPFNSINAVTSPEYKELYNGQHYEPDAGRTDLHCSHCQCNIDWKTAALGEDCGLTYYNANNPLNTQELKWEAFKKNQTND